MPVDLDVDGEPRELPVGIDLSAYRVIQEGLTNALKHADRAHVAVHVHYGPRSLELEIADDGSGTDTDVPGGGHGTRTRRTPPPCSRLSCGPRVGRGGPVGVPAGP